MGVLRIPYQIWQLQLSQYYPLLQTCSFPLNLNLQEILTKTSLLEFCFTNHTHSLTQECTSLTDIFTCIYPHLLTYIPPYSASSTLLDNCVSHWAWQTVCYMVFSFLWFFLPFLFTLLSKEICFPMLFLHRMFVTYVLQRHKLQIFSADFYWFFLLVEFTISSIILDSKDLLQAV